MLTLNSLPYSIDALEPHISKNTLNYHYSKHHATYLNNLNKLIENDPQFKDLSLTSIIKKAHDEGNNPIFNNSAQVWNHDFYWKCMKPNGGGMPTKKILDKISQSFGSFENFVNEFTQAAMTQFGSGWAWLIVENDQLKIWKTANADTPIANNKIPILTCDVWEHAYYLDYQNRRLNYVEMFLNNLINWEFVENNLI